MFTDPTIGVELLLTEIQSDVTQRYLLSCLDECGIQSELQAHGNTRRVLCSTLTQHLDKLWELEQM